MAPKTQKPKKKPTPSEFLANVRGESRAKTYEFDDYIEAVDELIERKGYSYADVAAYLAEKLGIAVTRGQVYRAHGLWTKMKEEDEEERRNSAMADEEGFRSPEEEEQQKLMNQAATKVVRFVEDSFPRESPLGNHAEILKLALAFVDADTRDELNAAMSDKRREKGV